MKVSKEKTLETPQEKFWRSDFGNDYSKRCSGDNLVMNNIGLFCDSLKTIGKIDSVVELGCNIGLNLRALKKINPDIKLTGYEINEFAAGKARNLEIADIKVASIIDRIEEENKFDLSFIKTVLIHINPEELSKVYQNLYSLTKRYVLIVEYYNPTPVTVSYRGNDDRLFKRDFAGEMIDKYNMKLVDYGFVYHRDNMFPLDDMNWFLLEK